MISFGKIGEKNKTNMDFTFGIITNNGQYINAIINSIRDLNIKNYEIIIVGKYSFDKNSDDIIFIDYTDDSEQFSISIKKNLITKKSKYENIVYLHDYIIFDKEWYQGFLRFGNEFDVCMNKINNIDGSRYRDWCLWKYDADKYVSANNYLIPYDIKNLSNMMYISGAYWVAKNKFMLDNPLNEKLKWEQGEDVEWSLRVRNKTQFKINNYSSVNLLKKKDRIFNETSSYENEILKSIESYNNDYSYDDLLINHIGKWI